MSSRHNATNRMRLHLGDHHADGSNAMGEGLSVTIRIAPDGRVYFYDIPPGLVGVFETLRGCASTPQSSVSPCRTRDADPATPSLATPAECGDGCLPHPATSSCAVSKAIDQ
ncbi:MAG: hypothetical protein KF864_10735 [Phycisphaeraceae bacterium]|nr:hypothetical protein [Phycisphaeraceae bacterium]